MKLSLLVTAPLLALALVPLAGARRSLLGPEPTRVVVGTFDSRAVAVAWARSDGFRRELEALRAQLEEARAREDLARIAEIEARGPALQERLHRQGFGTEPVDDILARFSAQLSALAEEAGVDVVVSRWALAWQRPGTRFVDLTEPLVERIGVDEETRAMVRRLVETEPVPREQLDREQH